MTATVLVVDDEKDFGELISGRLAKRGFAPVLANSPESARSAMGCAAIDAVVSDVRLGGESGLELCKELARMRPGLPVVLMTAFGDLETAIEAIRSGAHDFVIKPFKIDQLAHSLERALELRQLREEVKRLRALSTEPPESAILGDSRATQRVREVIDRVSETPDRALITGEHGSGKTLAARLVQQRRGPQERVHQVMCDSLSNKEIRRQLYADPTPQYIILEEVAFLSRSAQNEMSAFLEAHPQVSWVATSSSDLASMVESGEFSDELFYRLHTVDIDIPPLRMRGNDVLLIAQGEIAAASARLNKAVRGMTPEYAEDLLGYDWPSNVRELKHEVQRSVALTSFSELTVDDLPEKIRCHQTTRFAFEVDDLAMLPTLQGLEERYIRRVLEVTKENKSQAARILGINRRSLYRKLERFGITLKAPSKGS